MGRFLAARQRVQNEIERCLREAEKARARAHADGAGQSEWRHVAALWEELAREYLSLPLEQDLYAS